MRNHRLFVLALMFLALPGVAADDARFLKLEQDVRRLEQNVRDLSRQIEELRRQMARTSEAPAGRSRKPGPAANPSTAWLNAGNWNQVRVGMSEFEVISLLGPPTSMRVEGAARVLLYATEIGSTGFLAGSVTLRDRQVTEVTHPVLK